MQMRAANLQAQTAAKTQFYESVQRFEQWLIDFRTTPPSFNDADACEINICRISVGFGSRHHCRRCGITVCDDHSKSRRFIHVFGFSESRVRTCETCSDGLDSGAELMESLRRFNAVEPSRVHAEWTLQAERLGITAGAVTQHVAELLAQQETLDQLHSELAQLSKSIHRIKSTARLSKLGFSSELSPPSYWSSAPAAFKQIDVTADLGQTIQVYRPTYQRSADLCVCRR